MFTTFTLEKIRDKQIDKQKETDRLRLAEAPWPVWSSWRWRREEWRPVTWRRSSCTWTAEGYRLYCHSQHSHPLTTT